MTPEQFIAELMDHCRESGYPVINVFTAEDLITLQLDLDELEKIR
jgi:hypothetical protein